jgi:hypothetical protein
MVQFDMPNKVAFITAFPAGLSHIGTFTQHLVQSMIAASGGTLEPVLIAVQSDPSRDYSEAMNFVIRKEFRSDYMEAADFINSGNGDMVVMQHHFDLLGGESSSCFGEMLKRIDAPVLTTLHDVPRNLPECHYQNLIDVCDASLRVIVKHQGEMEVLNKQYQVPLNKIDLIIPEGSDYAFDPQEKWFRIGRQYWQLVSDQLCLTAGDLRSHQAAREHSLLYWQ